MYARETLTPIDPANERDVPEPELLDYMANIRTELLEGVLAVRLLRMSHTPKIESDAAVTVLKSVELTIPGALAAKPSVNEEDRLALPPAHVVDLHAIVSHRLRHKGTS